MTKPHRTPKQRVQWKYPNARAIQDWSTGKRKHKLYLNYPQDKEIYQIEDNAQDVWDMAATRLGL